MDKKQTFFLTESITYYTYRDTQRHHAGRFKMREMLLLSFLLADMFIGFYGIDRVRVRTSLSQETTGGTSGGTTTTVRTMDESFPPPH